MPAASMKVLAMPPPTISWSTFAASCARIVSLVDTLAPPTIATMRPLRVLQRLAQRLELLRQQRARAGHRRVLGDAVCGGLGSMGSREGIVDVDIAQRRHLLRQRVVVLLLALVEAAVLQQHRFARLDADPSSQSRLSGTSWPSSSDSRLATGASDSFSSNCPSVGRPRCDTSISRAPLESAWRMPGSEARMRVSSVITPSCSGTLKSSRISTRLPARSRSVILRIGMEVRDS